MSEIIQSHTSGSNVGVVAIAIGTAIAVGQPVWTERSPPYFIEKTGHSYSEIAEQIHASFRDPHAHFVDRITSIYSSLNDRQQLMGAEYEAAIFDDLDSLYES